MKMMGIIDLGSNSIRLVIYMINPMIRFKELYNLKVTARVSQHTNKDKSITKKGINLIIEALDSFREVLSFHQVKEVIGVATAAIRQAPNQAEILSRIKRETGFSFKVLSEYEEAYYGFLAVNSSTHLDSGITIDIGGGSTEITLFERKKLIYYHSFPFGAITLTRQFFTKPIPSSIEIYHLYAFLDEQFEQLTWLKGCGLPIIGIGGSARNLTLIQQSLIHYPLPGIHQFEMAPQDIEEILSMLATKPVKERQKMEGLSRDRADIIIAGIQTIAALTKNVSAPLFIMSQKGLRDGIFLEQLFKEQGIERYINVEEESYHQLAHEFNIDLSQAMQVKRLANNIFQAINAHYNPMLDEEMNRLLNHAARLVYLGDYISSDDSSSHTFYILTHRSIQGLSPRQRVMLALVASFKSCASFLERFKPYKHWFNQQEKKEMMLLGAILKLSQALNITKRGIVRQVRHVSSHGHKRLCLQIEHLHNARFEILKSEDSKKHLERQLKKKLELTFLKVE